MSSLYADLVAIGATLDHHESDLYVRCEPEAMRLVVASGRAYRVFSAVGDSTAWVDVPFAYDPFWVRAEKRIVAEGVRLA